MTPDNVKRPLKGWQYAYVAGVIDFHSTISVSVQQNDDYSVGHFIHYQLKISNTNRDSIGLIDDFCRKHDIDNKLRVNKNSHVIEISKRDSIEKLLRLVHPFLIGRHEPVEKLVDKLFPLLNNDGTRTKRDFIEIVEIVDEIRKQTDTSGGTKYDSAYFKEKWEV